MSCHILDCNNKVARMGLCQKHYRAEAAERTARGEKLKPGPSQDPTKPYSKHKARVRALATDTHCARGHEFEAVGYYQQATGKKQCKLCRANSQRRSEGREEVESIGLANKDKTHCPKGHELSGENLYIHPTKGYRRCLACHTTNYRKWYLRETYDITVEEFEKMLADQDSRCLGCGNEFTDNVKVDHDHETGAVRGLLCNGCNIALGHTYDNPDILRNLANYLEAFSAKTEE